MAEILGCLGGCPHLWLQQGGSGGREEMGSSRAHWGAPAAPTPAAMVSGEWLSLFSIFLISPENLSWTTSSQTLQERELEEMQFWLSPWPAKETLNNVGRMLSSE